jgi:thiosulfate/3-mercaptopyruvate sulfurtransferase
VLDGGLTAWRAESGPLEQGPSALEPTDFAATERPGFFVDQSEVLAIVEGRARGRLVCVLRPEVFAGTEQRYSRPGHIPLSVNLPYVELLGPDDRFLPERALRKALAPLFSGDERLILYCGAPLPPQGQRLFLPFSAQPTSRSTTAPFPSGQPTPACQWSWTSILPSRRAGRHEGPLVSQPCGWEVPMA